MKRGFLTGFIGLPPAPSARTRAMPKAIFLRCSGSSQIAFARKATYALHCVAGGVRMQLPGSQSGTVLSLQGPPVGQLPWPRRSGAEIACAAGSVVRFAPQPSSPTRTQYAAPPHLLRPPAASFRPPPAGARQPLQ